MVYLFLGSDSLSKDKQLDLIRKQFLSKDTEQFNLDILHAKDLPLKTLQEKLLWLPVKSEKRVVVIKDVQELKEEAREFLLKFVKATDKKIILVLDVTKSDRKDSFLNQLTGLAKTIRFKETIQPDTFSLSRQIAQRRPDMALKILSQLIQEGEKPERILGGLRYVWEKDTAHPLESARRLKLLLNCDIEIKTGRLKPVFALEKLVVKLCSFGKPLS